MTCSSCGTDSSCGTENKLARISAVAAERRLRCQPRLAQLLGLGEHESRDRQDLFAAWRLFFERLADVYPTVLAWHSRLLRSARHNRREIDVFPALYRCKHKVSADSCP
jgi:hypothetical protein